MKKTHLSKKLTCSRQIVRTLQADELLRVVGGDETTNCGASTYPTCPNFVPQPDPPG